MEKKIFQLLRTNKTVKALGYSQKELKGVASYIANNLSSEDNTPEDEINAEIDEQIEAIIPILSFGQQQASRALENWKRNHATGEDTLQDDGQEPGQENATATGHPAQQQQSSTEKNVEVPAWAQTLTDNMKALQTEISAIKGRNLTDQRRERLQALLKNTGVFGEQAMKQFARMKFADDEDFDNYVNDVEQDLKNLNQERANAGLSVLGKPTSTQQNNQSEKPYTPEQVAQIFHWFFN